MPTRKSSLYFRNIICEEKIFVNESLYSGWISSRSESAQKFKKKNDWLNNSYWLCAIILTGCQPKIRERLIIDLGCRGMDARLGFDPMHQMDPYCVFAEREYPVSCHFSEKSISLPSSFGLTGDDILHIATTFLDELAKCERDSISAD
jgi:dTDP-4-amino-4,6-dideoxygalactose transaminase